MAISAQCECGKRISVSDVLAGKTIRCPQCGKGIAIGGVPQKARGAPAKPRPRGSPGIYISKGKLIALGVVVVFGIVGYTFYSGPLNVHFQWVEKAQKADSDLRDVIPFAIEAYTSQHSYYYPSKTHVAPFLDGDIHFYRDFWVMELPDKIRFDGKSTQGDFSGYYHPATGEIEADVSYGGYTVAGLADVAKPTGTFHMTGRENNGQPEAESGGYKLRVIAQQRRPEE